MYNKLFYKYYYNINYNRFNLGNFCVLLLKKKYYKLNSLGVLIKKRIKKTVKRITIGNFIKKNIIIMSYNLYSNNIKKILVSNKKYIKFKRYCYNINIYNKLKYLK